MVGISSQRRQFQIQIDSSKAFTDSNVRQDPPARRASAIGIENSTAGRPRGGFVASAGRGDAAANLATHVRRSDPGAPEAEKPSP